MVCGVQHGDARCDSDGYGGRGGGRGGFDRGPPERVVAVASYTNTIENDLICCSVLEKRVPLLMRNIYMENKTLIECSDTHLFEIILSSFHHHFNHKNVNGLEDHLSS